MTTITDFFNKHGATLNYDELGKTQILTHSYAHGWSIRKNPSKLEKALDPSFNQKHVMKMWDGVYLKDNENYDKMNLRLQAIWEERYPNKELPTYFREVGNAISTQNPQLICFALNQTEELELMAVAKYINAHPRDESVILVQSLSAGKVSQAKNNMLTKFLDPERLVQGFEPEKFKDILSDILHKESQHLEAFYEAVKKMKASLQNSILIQNTPEELNLIDESLAAFKQAYKSFAQCVMAPGEADKLAAEVTNKIKTETQNAILDISSIDKIVHPYVQALIDVANKHINECSPETAKKIIDTYPKRVNSMCQEVEKQLKSGKHVYLITGAPFILPTAQIKESHMLAETAYETFKQFSFTIFYSKNAGNVDVKKLKFDSRN